MAKNKNKSRQNVGKSFKNKNGSVLKHKTKNLNKNKLKNMLVKEGLFKTNENEKSPIASNLVINTKNKPKKIKIQMAKNNNKLSIKPGQSKANESVQHGNNNSSSPKPKSQVKQTKTTDKKVKNQKENNVPIKLPQAAKKILSKNKKKSPANMSSKNLKNNIFTKKNNQLNSSHENAPINATKSPSDKSTNNNDLQKNAAQAKLPNGKQSKMIKIKKRTPTDAGHSINDNQTHGLHKIPKNAANSHKNKQTKINDTQKNSPEITTKSSNGKKTKNKNTTKNTQKDAKKLNNNAVPIIKIAKKSTKIKKSKINLTNDDDTNVDEIPYAKSSDENHTELNVKSLKQIIDNLKNILPEVSVPLKGESKAVASNLNKQNNGTQTKTKINLNKQEKPETNKKLKREKADDAEEIVQSSKKRKLSDGKIKYKPKKEWSSDYSGSDNDSYIDQFFTDNDFDDVESEIDNTFDSDSFNGIKEYSENSVDQSYSENESFNGSSDSADKMQANDSEDSFDYSNGEDSENKSSNGYSDSANEMQAHDSEDSFDYSNGEDSEKESSDGFSDADIQSKSNSEDHSDYGNDESTSDAANGSYNELTVIHNDIHSNNSEESFDFSGEEIVFDERDDVEFSSSNSDNDGNDSNGQELVHYNEMSNNSSVDSYSEEESEDSEYYEHGSFKDNSDWTSEESFEIENSYCSDDEDSFTDDSNEDYHGIFNGDSYDDDDTNDEDYIGNDDELYIKRGDAVVYDINNDNNYSFNSSDDGPQIFEISTAPKTSSWTQTTTNDDIVSDTDSCPELVPITSATNVTPLTVPIIVKVDEKHVWPECPMNLEQTPRKVNKAKSTAQNIILNMSANSKHIQTSVDITQLGIEKVEVKQDELSETVSANKADEMIATDVTMDEMNQIPAESFNEFNDDENTFWQPNNETFNDTAAFEEEFSVAVRPKFFNALNSRQVLAVLKSPLHFHGILKVNLLAGKANVYGYDLEVNKSVSVISPRGHSFIALTPVKPDAEPTNSKDIEIEFLKSSFLHTDIDKAIESFDPSNDALLLLEWDTTNKSVSMLDKYMKQTVFPNINTLNTHRAFYSTEFILHTQFFMKPNTRLNINPEWKAIQVNAASKIMVIGGKNVGKSTLVRYLTNSNLREHGKVLLIDLDIGQPELFVPQTVSATCVTEPILGPGYLQNRSPNKAFLFGDINVLISPIKYLKCVLKLLESCANTPEFQNIPWVVNTMGYNRGFGLELTVAILKALQPTDLIQIKGHRSLDNFDRILHSEEINSFEFNIFQNEVDTLPRDCNFKFHLISSMTKKMGVRTKEWDMTPKDLRFATILANLATMLEGTAEWITDVKPVCTSFNELQIIVSNEDHINPELLPHLLNANLVYLCQKTDSTEDVVQHCDTSIIECFGIGIIRAIDSTTNKIYLLPSIEMDKLVNVQALAVCNIPLPTSAILNHSTRVKGNVPYVYNTDDFLGSKQIVPITYRPKHLPKENIRT